MTLTGARIAALRTAMLAVVGLVCLLYAVLAIVQNRPDPFAWYIPVLFGVLAALITLALFLAAQGPASRAASDELYRDTVRRAAAHAYWIALALYPVFALLVPALGLQWATAFAAMSTATGAAYLLLLVLYEWRQG